MAVLPDPDDFSRYAAFHIHTTTYKTVGLHSIALGVLAPRNLKCPAAGAPIILRFHGGGFVTGSALYPGFFPPYLLQYAIDHSAIIVSPNYRLFPESHQSDILKDSEDAWQWMHSSLPAYLASVTDSAVKPDLTRIITTGDSAGGYLSLMTGLNHPEGVRAVTAAYPCTDLKSRFFTEHYEKQLFVFPQMNLAALEAAHAAKMAETNMAVRSEDPTLSEISLMVAYIQRGVIVHKFFDVDDASQFPIERVERGERFPRGGVWMWHGKTGRISSLRL
jgi:acetyl esterase/lipase